MSKSSFGQRCVYSTVCVLLCAGMNLFAQADTAGTASIAGMVTDPSGHSVDKATIAARNDVSGAVKTATSTDDGKFAITGLPAGSYSVDVIATGLAFDTRTGLQVSSGATITVPVSMRVATVSQTVTVEAAVTLAVEAAPSQSSLDAATA